MGLRPLLFAALLALTGPALAASAGGPKWHEDAYDAALAEARTSGRPLVIDLWAQWCHTCLSMKHTVLVEPGMAAVADRFVWLAMDTDRSVNAPALAKFPPEVWPTFFVVDPRDESVAARLLGSTDLPGFLSFLEAGERRVAGRESPYEAAARAGAIAAAGGRHGEAADAFAAAIAGAPADWPRGPAVRVSHLNALYRLGAYERCAAAGGEGLEAAVRGHTPAAADFIYYVDACVVKAKGIDRAALSGRAATALGRIVDDAQAPLSVDDRSEALRILRELEVGLGHAERARARAEQQRELLDRAAAAADARTAMTWHWPRAEVYAFLGEPARLIPDLKASMAALPDAYEPPYRLAWIQLRAGALDDARVSARAAIERVYGPRAARAWGLLADIEEARGDRTAARSALVKAVEVWRGLPEGQARPASHAAAEARLVEFDAARVP